MLCEHPPSAGKLQISFSNHDSIANADNDNDHLTAVVNAFDDDNENQTPYKPQPPLLRQLVRRASVANLIAERERRRRRTGQLCLFCFCIGVVSYVTLLSNNNVQVMINRQLSSSAFKTYVGSDGDIRILEGSDDANSGNGLMTVGTGKGIPFSTEENISFFNSVIYKNQLLANEQKKMQEHHLLRQETEMNGLLENEQQRMLEDSIDVDQIRSKAVAYVIVITECGNEPLWDGAAVLGRTIQLTSKVNPSSTSNYGYKLYAILSEDASNCADKYAKVGYQVLIKPNPVSVLDVQQGHYATNVETRCSYMKDFLTLYAWTLGNEHDIVVLTDVKTMFIQPLDELYDSMLFSKDTEIGNTARRNVQYHWMQYGIMDDTQRYHAYKYNFPNYIETYFTRDYTVVHPTVREKAGVQTGLIVLKPNMNYFDQMINIIKEGNFDKDYMGWYDSGFGAYPRGMCTKGLLSLFFTKVLKEQQNKVYVELNRCYYNAISDTHITKSVTPTIYNNAMNNEGVCRDGRMKCDDCRNVVNSIQQLKTVNTSICRRPWTCHYHNEQYNHEFSLCREMTHEWFLMRYQVEQELLKALGENNYHKSDAHGSFGVSYFMGYCDGWGQDGYLPMPLPNVSN